MVAADFHFHGIPPGFVDAMRRGAFGDVVTVVPGSDRLVFRAPAGVAVEPGLSIRPRVHDAGLLLEAMGRMRLDLAAVSSPPEFFLYWAPVATGARMAGIINDGYAEWAGAYPGRLSPLATLPMQDPAAAVVELDRAVGVLGLRGAAVCSHVNGVDLDDVRFGPVFAALERLGVPLFLHPQNAGDMTRLADHHLWNIVGFPTETAVAAARLILSGTLARYPGVRVVLAHGGGALPYLLGRLDHGWRSRAALREACPEPPSAYLRQIWCDSLVHSAEALAFLVRRVGEDRVVLGTDYPFDMGDSAPLEGLGLAGFGERVRGKVAGGTVLGLLGLG